MRRTRNSPLLAAVAAAALLAAGWGLGVWHARAWGLGTRSPVLSFDAAQYALAARTLATRGTLATPFALPLDLVKHGTPPWPLSAVQPGLVVLEAAAERLVPPAAPWPGGGRWDTAARREWLAILISFGSYLALALVISRTVHAQLEALDPNGAPGIHRVIGFGAGAVFLLDPEAQHYALGGFTELPFTLGLVGALALLARGTPLTRPLAWGLVLGATATLRGTLIVLIPVLIVVAALLAPRERRGGVVALVLAGTLMPLAPWWFYKWRAFGTPTWDLSALGLWDGVGGHTWLDLTHRPAWPQLPGGGALVAGLTAKLARQLAALVAGFAATPAGVGALLMGGALVMSPAADEGRPSDPAARRSARAAAIVALIHAVVALVLAALGAGWLRYLFPARVPIEVAAFVAAWLGLARARRGVLAGVPTLVLALGLVVFAAGWGWTGTVRGNDEAAAAATVRGVPSVATLEELSRMLERAVPPGEVVMSNLGPLLAWYSGHPVLHLALAPADLAACRERTPFRQVLLVFRDPAHAWPAWGAIFASPPREGALGARILRERERFATRDGFAVVWLEYAP